MRRIALALLMQVVAFSWSSAQEPTVRAGIQPESGITDTTPVQLTIEILGAQNPRFTPPALGRLTNLSLISGPNTSSSFSWINGRTSASYEIRYTLLPKGAGEAVIPPMTLQINSKEYALEAIRFQVAAAPPTGRPGPGPSRGARDQADVLLRAQLGSDEVWVGQPVPLTATIWAAQRVSDPRWRSQPGFGSFWVETVDVDPDRESFTGQLAGRNYRVYPVDRKVLVPLSAGEFTIDPYVVQLQVASQNRDWFDLFGRSQTLIRKSEPLSLRVRALPAGAPEGFSGAVGSYTFDVSLDRTEAAVNEAIALRATVQGEGSLRTVEAPAFDSPPELKVYDPEVTGAAEVRAGRMISRKTWEWILIPLAPGQLELPRLTFSYFDPQAGEYRVADSGPMLLAVERGDGVANVPVARGGIPLERRDLQFIKPLRGELAGERAALHERGLFLALLAAPLVWVPLFVALGRRRDRLNRDLGLARGRRAGARARKRLQAARKQLHLADAATFHAALARALVEYVADRFNRAPAGLTYELADNLWAARGVDEALRRRFRACLEACDFARFVPAAASEERRSELLDEAAEVVEQLERTW